MLPLVMSLHIFKNFVLSVAKPTYGEHDVIGSFETNYVRFFNTMNVPIDHRAQRFAGRGLGRASEGFMAGDKFGTTYSMTLTWSIRDKCPQWAAIEFEKVFNACDSEECWRLVAKIALESELMIPFYVKLLGCRQKYVDFAQSVCHIQDLVFQEVRQSRVFGVGADGIKIRIVAKNDQFFRLEVDCDLEHQIVSFTIVERPVSIGDKQA